MTTLNLQVAASADDADEDNTDAVSITTTQKISDHASEYHGHRFRSASVPTGSTIDVATLTLWIIDNNSDEPLHRLWGEDEDNPGAFAEIDLNISSRTHTTASVDWDSTDLGISAGGAWAAWPACTAIVQEIVDRPAFAGDALVLMYTQPATTGTRDLGVVFYDGDSSKAAKLDITYTAAAAVSLHILGQVAQQRKRTRRINGIRTLSR